MGYWFVFILISFATINRNYASGDGEPFPPPSDDWSVKCTDHAFWVILPINSTIVSLALPDGVTLDQIPEPFVQEVPSGTHPVIFELGFQQNCYYRYLPFVELRFHELKYDIPYVKSTINGSPLMSKPIIYMDSTVNAYASDLVYGLPDVVAQNMSFENLLYSANSTSGAMFWSAFTTDFDFGSANASSQFSAFNAINNYPWLCHPPPLDTEKCASDWYDWDNMKIRSLKTSQISFTAGFFPGMPGSMYSFDYPKLLIGASEVIVDLYISSPSSCTV